MYFINGAKTGFVEYKLVIEGEFAIEYDMVAAAKIGRIKYF